MERARVLGLRLGKANACPLHPHCTSRIVERKVHGARTAFVWTCGNDVVTGLAELYAHKAGRQLRFAKDGKTLVIPGTADGRAEVHRWRQLLDYDAGNFRPCALIEAAQASIPDVPAPCRHVLDAIVRMLVLRQLCGGYALHERFLWARAFAVPYTGMTEHRARMGLDQAREHALVLPAGEEKRGVRRYRYWTLNLPVDDLYGKGGVVAITFAHDGH
jgi:hypothetical protein